MAHNGMLVVMMLASAGEVSPTPKMKQPWLNTMASNEAPSSLAMSLWCTCSGFWKKETSQKSTMAPKMRRSVSTSGLMRPPAMTIFATGDMSPHMALAASIEPCPFQLKLPIFVYLFNASISSIYSRVLLSRGILCCPPSLPFCASQSWKSPGRATMTSSGCRAKLF